MGFYRIILIYFVAGVLWITLSDHALVLITNENSALLTKLQNYKGLFYVSTTTVLLYFLIKHHHLSLNKSVSQYRKMFDNHPHPMWITHKQSMKILAVNNAAIQKYGYSKKEFLNMYAYQMRPEADREVLKKQIALRAPGLTFAGIWRHLKKNGQTVYADIAVHSIDFDDELCELVSAVDVTERENKARENEKLLQEIMHRDSYLNTLINSGSHFLVRLNNKDTSLFCNGHFRETFLKGATMFPTREDFYELIDTRLSPGSLKDVVKKCLDNPNTIHPLLVRMKSNEGMMWVEWEFAGITAPGQLKEVQALGRNVTERTKEQRYLTALSKASEDVANQLPGGFLSFDNNYTITRFNLRAEELLELSAAQALGNTVAQVFQELKYAHLVTAIHACVKEMKAINYRGAIGKWTDISFHVFPVHTGTVVYMQALHTSVPHGTTPTLAKEIIALEHEYVCIGYDRKIIHTSPGLASSVSAWQLSALPAPYMQLLEAGFNKEISSLEARSPFSNRRSRITVFPMQEGVLMLIADIEDKKKEEEGLRKDLELYSLITKATNDTWWEWDLENDVIHWSDNVCKMFNYLPEQVDSSPAWWYANVHPQDVDRVVDKIHHHIDTKKEHWSDEYRFKCADGSFKYVYDRGYLMLNSEGRACRFVGAIMDMEYAKSIEKKILTQNNRLKEIAWIQSHKVRQPLTSILGLVTLLDKNNPQTEFNGEVVDYLRKAALQLDEAVKSVVEKADKD